MCLGATTERPDPYPSEYPRCSSSQAGVLRGEVGMGQGVPWQGF